MNAPNQMPTPPLRFFWQPGCSSCVKVKELLGDLGVEFASVNILEQAGSMDELLARGIRSVPVLLRGEEMIFAQSLEDVARFVGRERVANRLPPAELMSRWLYFLDTGMDLIRRIPPARLDVRPVPNRDRSVCALAYHIYQIPNGFLETVLNGLEDSRELTNARRDDLRTIDDLLAYAGDVVPRLRHWGRDLPDDAGARRIKTYYGLQPLHQILERGTWHSAQHTRQLAATLDRLGAPHAPIAASAYTGLPMPETLWA